MTLVCWDAKKHPSVNNAFAFSSFRLVILNQTINHLIDVFKGHLRTWAPPKKQPRGQIFGH